MNHFSCVQGVQRPGKSGNVGEFRYKERKSRKSQEIFKSKKVREKLGNFVV